MSDSDYDQITDNSFEIKSVSRFLCWEEPDPADNQIGLASDDFGIISLQTLPSSSYEFMDSELNLVIDATTQAAIEKIVEIDKKKQNG